MRTNCIHKPIIDPQYSLHLSLLMAKGDEGHALALRTTALWQVALYGNDGMDTPPFYHKRLKRKCGPQS